MELAPELKTPWIGFFGDRDESVPVEEVEDLAPAVAKSAVETEIVRYPDAGHGFNCDERQSYHKEAAADAWERMLAFLGRWLSQESE
jgi:carboxymethylenebutenolidase